MWSLKKETSWCPKSSNQSCKRRRHKPKGDVMVTDITNELLVQQTEIALFIFGKIIHDSNRHCGKQTVSVFRHPSPGLHTHTHTCPACVCWRSVLYLNMNLNMNLFTAALSELPLCVCVCAVHSVRATFTAPAHTITTLPWFLCFIYTHTHKSHRHLRKHTLSPGGMDCGCAACHSVNLHICGCLMCECVFVYQCVSVCRMFLCKR